MKKQNMKTVTQGCPFSLFATRRAHGKQKLDGAYKELCSGHVYSIVVFVMWQFHCYKKVFDGINRMILELHIYRRADKSLA